MYKATIIKYVRYFLSHWIGQAKLLSGQQMHIFLGLAIQRHSQGTKEEEVHACQCITCDKNKMDGRGHYGARREIISLWTSYLHTLVLEHSPWFTMHSLANKNKQLPVSHGFKLCLAFLQSQATQVRLMSCTQPILKCCKISYITPIWVCSVSLGFSEMHIDWNWKGWK